MLVVIINVCVFDDLDQELSWVCLWIENNTTIYVLLPMLIGVLLGRTIALLAISFIVTLIVVVGLLKVGNYDSCKIVGFTSICGSQANAFVAHSTIVGWTLNSLVMRSTVFRLRLLGIKSQLTVEFSHGHPRSTFFFAIAVSWSRRTSVFRERLCPSVKDPLLLSLLIDLANVAFWQKDFSLWVRSDPILEIVVAADEIHLNCAVVWKLCFYEVLCISTNVIFIIPYRLRGLSFDLIVFNWSLSSFQCALVLLRLHNSWPLIPLWRLDISRLSNR